MSNLLQEYITAQLVERVTKYGVVVWYDPRSEFRTFVAELSGLSTSDSPTEIDVAGSAVRLATYDGSFYALRCGVESLVAADDPQPIVLYMPGLTADVRGSVLMELELAGCRWEPKLRQLARNAMRQRFTDGAMDDLLGRAKVTYEDLVAAVAAGGEGGPPSLLKPLLSGASGEAQLATWLANAGLDQRIVEKEATTELGRLIAVRLGIDLGGDNLAKWRAITVRHALAVEFRSDLAGDLPNHLQHLPAAAGDAERNARALARILRDDHAASYPDLADRAAKELKLDSGSVDAFRLGSIDTFRFEERSLLDRCAALITDGDYSHVIEIAAARQGSFWLQEAIDRQAQWEAIRLAADLGAAAEAVIKDLARPPAGAAAWVTSYADRWHTVDRVQRQLEAWLPKLDEDADERAIAAVRQRYDVAINKLAEGFVAALQADQWAIDGHLQQTSIYDDLVRPQPGRVAYFLVDAMRYEMGAELAQRLDGQGEVSIRPAVGVLPSITPTGMAALMPGAAASYDVVDRDGRLMAKIGGDGLADLRARKKHLAARVASSVDLELGEVLALSRTRLARKLGSSELVVVRSQEIDFFGEGGFQARSIMDTVIDNLARAVRRLAGVGVDRVVITADHGHLYSAEDRDESMRIDAPGGATVDLHRRCWIGRGGATPASCVRVAASSLGNDSDLDFVFPVGIGVFRAGGDLAFHHGGPSLQEMIVPVITVRSIGAVPASGGATVSVTDVPPAVTNRIFSVKVSLATLAGDRVPVRPVLMSGDGQVGEAGMVLGADHDRSSGTVMLVPGAEVTIGFVLDDDSSDAVRIVVLDPATDAELYRSPVDVPIRLGVS
jgi:PglZ domain